MVGELDNAISAFVRRFAAVDQFSVGPIALVEASGKAYAVALVVSGEADPVIVVAQSSAGRWIGVALGTDLSKSGLPDSVLAVVDKTWATAD